MSRSFETQRVRRGARRALMNQGVETALEFSPCRSLRTDLFGFGEDGSIWIVEVKSGLEDFRTDQKWTGYKEWCDFFLFAVGPAFPLDLLPDDVGVLRADDYDGAIIRPPAAHKLAPARRKALTLRFARHCAARLRRLDDPDSVTPGL